MFAGGREDKNIMFRTMLVEDNHSFRQVVKLYLQSQFPSMSIIEAADGVEALMEIYYSPPNLIFMDFKLPGENGLELTRKIKASHPNIIIILFTNYDLQEIQKVATQCKPDYFFNKGSMATGEIAALVKSILLEKGFRANGSMEAFELRRRGKIRPRVLKGRIWWESVPDASSYGVYVSKDRTLLEPGQFSWETTPGIISKTVIGKTELIIPDEWPEFPREPGTYHIGITSKDDLGNQSDPLLLSGLFKFFALPSPLRGGIEYQDPSFHPFLSSLATTGTDRLLVQKDRRRRRMRHNFPRNPIICIGLIIFSFLVPLQITDGTNFTRTRCANVLSKVPLGKTLPYEPPSEVFDTPTLPPSEPTPFNYDPVIREAAKRYSVDYALVKAVIKVESNFDPLAISRAGARGLMQLMPGTADVLRVKDPFHPEDNIEGGVRHLRYLLDLFKGNLHLVLAAYNAGEEAVFRYNDIPPDRETRIYVDRVLQYFRNYSREFKSPDSSSKPTNQK
jgi:CheY-like chemotaxis protein